MPDSQYRCLRLVLGDQLDLQHSWFKQTDAGVVYLIAELKQEAGYVKHHVQKLCAFFAAMDRFAATLRKQGHEVIHLTLDDTSKYKDLEELLKVYCDSCAVSVFDYQAPDEYRLRAQLRGLRLGSSIEVNECASEHFLLPEDDFDDYIVAGKHNRMESFYRKMRRRFDFLMDGDEPRGGKWNYDNDNRNKLRKDDFEKIPEPLTFANDVDAYLERLDRHQIEYFGKPERELIWPLDREQALELLAYFCAHCLPNFGRFQDAMSAAHEHRWSLFHSRLSFALNSKILHPREVLERAIEQAERHTDAISLAQIEGFVRQILGWREYVRAVYWQNMPDYAELDHFDAGRDLPEFFWSGETRMQCLKQAITQSLDFAYAHHIQRLMITGNFCLLAGIDPDQVDAWYLGIYIDAIEWVEMPNTRGMSQFADGGLVATKPYAAGGNYVNKMSDYCKSCDYEIKAKSGKQACPLNSLYWNFMVRHRDELETNPRIGMIYRNWDKQDKQQRRDTLSRADWCLRNLDQL